MCDHTYKCDLITLYYTSQKCDKKCEKKCESHFVFIITMQAQISCEITLIITLVSVILSEIHTVRSRIFRANKPPHDKAGIKDSGT